VRGDPRKLIGERRARSRARQESTTEQTKRENLELRERIASQWAEVRASRRAMEAEPQVVGGPSNLAPARVPYGMDLAAAWAWRFVVICAAGSIVLYLLDLFLVVVLPVVIALLLAALASPVVAWLQRLGLPRKVAALVIVVLGVLGIAALVAFVSNQVSAGMGDLSDQVVNGINQIRDWLRDGPLKITDSQLSTGLDQVQKKLSDMSSEAFATATEVGTAVGHLVAGLFIVLFATYFFLADGTMIWTWIVRIFPRAARTRADSSGRVAWRSLTQFVRATVMVAATDAIGIMIGAAILQVPFVSAIGVLVFLGAFIPLVGAFVSGTVAVLVALVAQGPVTALIMFGVVVLVQQIEAHILQPFLMGRFVSVHPLGVIIAIALGVIVAGIPGALIAVPLAASLNAVVQHLANFTEVGEDPEDASEDEAAPMPASVSGEQLADAHDAGRETGRETGTNGLTEAEAPPKEPPPGR
jgi:predicted PurR-regulated permease PerM